MDLDDRLARLTDSERAALRLFLQHTDVNRVAQALSLSTSAVAKRLLSARRKLGVGRSLDAALLVAQQEGTGRTVQVAPSPAGDPPPDLRIRPQPEESAVAWPHLFPTKGRPWNTLPAWSRLIVMICLLLLIAIAILVEVSVQTVLAQAFGR